MRGLTIACGVMLALTGGAAIAESAPVPVAAAPAATAAAYSSTTSTMETLTGNPATKAVLMKVVPDLMNSMGQNMDRVGGMTLKELQDVLKSYSPDALSDAKLAAIDAELAKIPAAN